MVVSILISLYDYIKNHEYWVNKFRFRFLPRVAQIEVLRAMDYCDILNMATASSKMKLIIKSIRIELPRYAIFVKGPWSCIQINGTITGARDFLDHLKEIGEQLCFEQLARRVQFVQNLFICKEIRLGINWDEKEEGIDIMNNQYLLPILQTCDWLVLMNGQIKSEDFEFILKTVKPSVFFKTWELKIPTDFQSENAFRPDEVRYEDSRWVKIEHLFTLKGLPYITLLNPTFNVFEINNLIKIWKTNENDMFRTLVFDFSERLATETLFSDLTVLKHFRVCSDFYFLISAPNTKKSKKGLCVWFSTEAIRLTSWSPDDRFKAFDDSEPFATFRREYDTLKVLEKKEELEKKLEDDKDERLPKIQREIEEINENLKKEGVVFLDGMYVI